jgi:hypothetical protein
MLTMDSTLQALIPWLNGEQGVLFRTALTISGPFLTNLKIQDNQTNLTLAEPSGIVKQNLSSSVPRDTRGRQAQVGQCEKRVAWEGQN